MSGVEALEALRGEADGLGRDGGHVDCGRGCGLLGAEAGVREGEGGNEEQRLGAGGGFSLGSFGALRRQAAGYGTLYIKMGAWRPGRETEGAGNCGSGFAVH